VKLLPKSTDDDGVFIDSLDRHHAKQIADKLADAFIWSESPQGFQYWADVKTALLKLAGAYHEASRPEGATVH